MSTEVYVVANWNEVPAYDSLLVFATYDLAKENSIHGRTWVTREIIHEKVTCSRCNGSGKIAG